MSWSFEICRPVPWKVFMAQYALQLLLLTNTAHSWNAEKICIDRPACWLRSAYPGSGKIACRQGSKTTRYIGGCHSIVYVKYSSIGLVDRG
ncbi:hypothetical protein BKA59DRAFT_479102 [Fusarium tricinctum]|uniref:Secreted protein n=1 Tax=Fusarium tricinctum TaxID=61284 RepID=A0A8K0RVA8_9HYPO|nr:hypothetical protein BKA59DRAFT_479102 [Fusarium tricinctum]